MLVPLYPADRDDASQPAALLFPPHHLNERWWWCAGRRHAGRWPPYAAAALARGVAEQHWAADTPCRLGQRRQIAQSVGTHKPFDFSAKCISPPAARSEHRRAGHAIHR